MDRKAIKQLVLGEYGYAVNALYSKKVVRDALLEKVCGSVIEECKDLCSVRKPSILRDTTPEGLKQFTESAHVTELSERAPVITPYCLLLLESLLLVKQEIRMEKMKPMMRVTQLHQR